MIHTIPERIGVGIKPPAEAWPSDVVRGVGERSGCVEVGGSWNIGLAYRPPDSNLNISMGYQQGRTNIQISMVPDEQASLLGPNGFTSGVGPANLGLSLNLNI